MNYRIQIDPMAILATGAAVDNASVFGSLKMARVALDEAVDRELDRCAADLAKGIEALKRAANERYRDLRAQRKSALRVREADLPSDESPAAALVGVRSMEFRHGEDDAAA